MVEAVVCEGRGHFLCMEGEKVGRGGEVVREKAGGQLVAEKCADWIGRKMKVEREVDAWWKGYDDGRSERGEGWRVSQLWEREVRGKADQKREGAGRAKL